MSFVEFRHGGLHYRLVEVHVCYVGVQFPGLAPGRAVAVLRAALASPTPVLATQIRRAFSNIDGGRAGSPTIPPAALADRIGALIRQGRMMLVGYEPVSSAMLVNRIDEAPKRASGDPNLIQRVRRVVGGLDDVPMSAISKSLQADFENFKKQMTESPALLITLGAVLAGWAASQAAPPIGLAIDAVLFGFAIYALGTQAFDWAERLAKLVGKINSARTDADFAACSLELMRLILMIGVSVFLTLLLRAAGKKLGKSVSKGEPELKTAPARQGPATRSTTRNDPAATSKPKPAPTKLPPNKDPTYARPSGYRKGVRDEVWDSAKGPDGKVRDPLTGAEMNKTDPWDMGHKDGFEFRKHQKSASERAISRKQFLDEHNDPRHYRPELPSSNQSHKGENLTDDYFGD